MFIINWLKNIFVNEKTKNTINVEIEDPIVKMPVPANKETPYGLQWGMSPSEILADEVETYAEKKKRIRKTKIKKNEEKTNDQHNSLSKKCHNGEIHDTQGILDDIYNCNFY